ncbi:MAG: FAD-dependent oxidoreductase [Mariprofundaceae bacterium]
MTQPIAIIGGGLTGLSCAIRLAEKGKDVQLFEAAPALGGRTRSFFDSTMNQWVDNGPHLLSGAYNATQALLEQVGAANHVQWQSTLNLPLWHQQRGHFKLQTQAWLPFPLALILGLYRLPGHTSSSLQGMLNLAKSLNAPTQSTVASWMQESQIPSLMLSDLIEPLCLGAMNENMDTANAQSFAHVLRNAFANHQTARLGWFKQPLSQALIEPLESYAKSLGVKICCRSMIRDLNMESRTFYVNGSKTDSFEAIVLAMPTYARNRLLKLDQHVETRPISNIHLWFNHLDAALPELFIGGIGTRGQWFFDVSAQLLETNKPRHICVVISADESKSSHTDMIQQACEELRGIIGQTSSLLPIHSKVICERRATTLVRKHARPPLPTGIINACESPQYGDLPATIETAIVRGEEAAKSLCFQ